MTKLLNPFLAPAPNTTEPFTPVAWAVLGWVRRNLFNQSPTINYNPTTSVQTGQTVSGNLGATDPEGDALTYKVTHQPAHGTLTIDQATGKFTYTPDDINYTAAQTDSFAVSVTDGKFNLLGLFSPHSAKAGIDVTVLNPTIQRVILNMPDGITNPTSSRFAADGKSILFSGAPSAGGRREIYQISVDGTDVKCLTCGVSPTVTADLNKMTPFEDGSGRILVEAGSNKWVVFEDGANGKQLASIATPPSGARVLEPTREMRISPDGTHVVFTQIQLGQGGVIAAVPIVGTLNRTASGYEIADARVIFPTGEAKQWTHDGKGVIILGGQYEAGNVDDVIVDMATGKVTRLTGNLDYDEDTDLSPNGKWLAIGSTRGLDALTPMSRIVRPAFLPAFIQGSVYERYANPINVSNQEWLIAVADDLNRENGIPLFVGGDGYTARSMPSWNETGDAVTFWERSITDPTQTRLVIANLKYTTSVGTVEGDQSTPHPMWAPQLGTYVPSAPPLPPTGTYAGVGGGTAVVSEAADPTNPAATIRTVTYTNYVNDQGMILNGTESTSTTASQNSVRYLADINVSGAHTGYLRGDVTINKLTRTITPTTTGSMITSDVDGDVLVLLDPARISEAQQDA